MAYNDEENRLLYSQYQEMSIHLSMFTQSNTWLTCTIHLVSLSFF